MDDDCFSDDTKERIKNKIDADKRALGYILAGGSEIIAGMQLNRPNCSFVSSSGRDPIQMNQSSMLDDFVASSSDEE
jgi:hypothetical protein